MLTPEQETEIRAKADKGICHKAGCNNTGKRRASLTFAALAPFDPPQAGRSRVVMATVQGWDCGEHRE